MEYSAQCLFRRKTQTLEVSYLSKVLNPVWQSTLFGFLTPYHTAVE